MLIRSRTVDQALSLFGFDLAFEPFWAIIRRMGLWNACLGMVVATLRPLMAKGMSAWQEFER